MILFKMHKNKKIILIALILDLYEEDIISEMYLFCVTFQYGI